MRGQREARASAWEPAWHTVQLLVPPGDGHRHVGVTTTPSCGGAGRAPSTGHARREFLLVFTLSGADVKPSSHVPTGQLPGGRAGSDCRDRDNRALQQSQERSGASRLAVHVPAGRGAGVKVVGTAPQWEGVSFPALRAWGPGLETRGTLPLRHP